MRKVACFILILLTCSLKVSAQELVGKITESDSAGTPIYQAVVTQSLDGKVIATYNTFFDGTYRLKVKPKETYEINASYPGHKDSTISVSIDKRNMLTDGTLNIALRKDGMRLMGYVMDRDQDIPIKDAGIVIRNVMTRKEEKYFTDVNGYYNLKMEFETNYSLHIDKRSPGILNKYQDTSFNISTIAFDQALDFKLDIKLGRASGHTTPRPGYDPHAAPDNKNLKPVIQVVGKKDSAKLKEQAATLSALQKKSGTKDEVSKATTPVAIDSTAIRKEQKAAADELKKKEEVARIKAEKDKQQQEEDTKRKAQQKAEADLKAKLKADDEQKAKEIAQIAKTRQDSISRAKQEEARKQQEATDKKRKDDDALRAKQQAEKEQKAKAEQAIADAKKAAASKKDTARVAQVVKKVQDTVSTSRVRIEPTVRITNTADEEKKSKSETKRLAKLHEAEQKQKLKDEKEAKKLADQQQKIAQLKADAEAEQKAEATRRAEKEAEDKKLKKQAERMNPTPPLVVITKEKAPEPKAIVQPPKKDQKAVTDIPKPAKEPSIKKADTIATPAVSAGTIHPESTKSIRVKGVVKNGLNEQLLPNTYVNIRCLNTIVSLEATTDSKGAYEFTVESGYFYLVSFTKNGYETTKQIVDLTSFSRGDYTMVIQYMKERDDFDPKAKWATIQFMKNSTLTPLELSADMYPVTKMMIDDPTLTMKIYGLASIDEDDPQDLSNKRAREVANIMMGNGINASRIQISGKGASRPRSGCTQNKQCTQEQYKLDRVVMYNLKKE